MARGALNSRKRHTQTHTHMRDREARRLRFLAAPTDESAQCHTTWKDATTIVFVPSAMSGSTDVVLAQFHAAMRPCLALAVVCIEVNCRDVDAATARRLWRERGVGAAYRGARAFASLPVRVAGVTVLRPRDAAWWDRALAFVLRMLPAKMRARVSVA